MVKFQIFLLGIMITLSTVSSQDDGIYSIYGFLGSCAARELVNGMTEPRQLSYTSGTSVTYHCDNGFRLIGDMSANCKDGEWDRSLPRCDVKYTPTTKPPPVKCPAHTLENGKLIPHQLSYVAGSSISYKCNNGFEVKGKSINVCLLDGSWAFAPPVCEAKKVAPRPCTKRVLENGKLNPDKEMYDNRDVVIYSCDDGYTIIGELAAACFNGEWTAELPFCKKDPEKTCERPPFTRGTIFPLKNVYSNLEVIQYDCEEGYSLKGHRTAACFEGKWTSDYPNCEDDLIFNNNQPNCLPPNIENGSYNPEQEGYEVGFELQIVCDVGYTKVGSNGPVICQKSLEWTTLPKCKMFCAPPVIENGSYKPKQNRYAVGDVLTVFCNADYVLHGVNEPIRCQDNGEWSTLPTCISGCVDPVIPNGFYNTQSAKVGPLFPRGSIIIIFCNPEYIIEGNNFLACGDNSMWSHQLPVCRKLVIEITETGCLPPTFPGVTYTPPLEEGQSVYSVGDKVNYICKGDTYSLRHNVADCQSDGSWSRKPSCPKKCTRPRIVNGRINKAAQSFRQNAVIKVICNRGYLAVGSKTARCRANGAWSARLRCTDGCYQPNIARMKISPLPISGGNVYNLGQRITFRCDAGFSATIPNAECRGGNRWDKTLPRCKLIAQTTRSGCGAPEMTEGLIMKNQRRNVYPYKTQFEFQCKKGFNMIGSAVSICRKHLRGPLGGLDPAPPRCERVKCGSPGKPQNGRFRDGDKGSYLFEDIVYFQCDDKHIMSGLDHITCQADGQFNGIPPLCQPPSCRVECVFVEGRECQCDAVCRIRGDCCYDFEQHCRKLFY